MPAEYKSLILTPGINVELSPTLNRSGWMASQLIRWFAKQAQKLGGWVRVSGVQAVGSVRGIFAWTDAITQPWAAWGSEQRLQVLDKSGITYDITPIQATSNLTAAFSTTATSKTVTIVDSYVPAVGDWINLTTQISIGGIVLFGFYRVVTASGGHYTITAASPATATVAGGGATPQYTTTASATGANVLLPNHGYPIGPIFGVLFMASVSTAVGGITIYGWTSILSVTDANNFVLNTLAAVSTATVSENAGLAQVLYLLPTGLPADALGVPTPNGGRQWIMDKWGASINLLAVPSGGSLYQWTPLFQIYPSTTGVVAQAQIVPNAPTAINTMFVMSQAQIVVAAGTTDPMLVQWCDVANNQTWTAAVSNQAGSFRLSSGSRIVAGASVNLSSLIWTDTSLYSMTYQGYPLVFGFNQVGLNCGAISPRCVVQISGSDVMWMSPLAFYRGGSGGAAVPVDCSVWDFFLSTYDQAQPDLVHAGTNAQFHEAKWYFQQIGGATAYIKFNWLDNLWDYGVLTRTCWIDRSAFGPPMGFDGTGLLQQHESAANADGAAMTSSIQTGYIDLSETGEFGFIDMLLPDFAANNAQYPGATVAITVLTINYPGDTPVNWGTSTVASSTPYVTMGARGRYFSFLIQSSDAGTFWRIGRMRYRITPDGNL